jgi:hypothetical protein
MINGAADGSNTRLTPTLIQGGLAFVKVVDIGAGMDISFALGGWTLSNSLYPSRSRISLSPSLSVSLSQSDENGALWSWGPSGFLLSSTCYDPVKLFSGPEDAGLVSIAIGWTHALALGECSGAGTQSRCLSHFFPSSHADSLGRVYSWGYEGLGVGLAASKFTPTFVESLADVKITAISAGKGSSMALGRAREGDG